MKNWNAFSIFQYLTGSEDIHLTFIIILGMQGKITRGKLGDLPDFYDHKEMIVKFMFYAHLLCFILQTNMSI